MNQLPEWIKTDEDFLLFAYKYTIYQLHQKVDLTTKDYINQYFEALSTEDQYQFLNLANNTLININNRFTDLQERLILKLESQRDCKYYYKKIYNEIKNECTMSKSKTIRSISYLICFIIRDYIYFRLDEKTNLESDEAIELAISIVEMILEDQDLLTLIRLYLNSLYDENIHEQGDLGITTTKYLLHRYLLLKGEINELILKELDDQIKEAIQKPDNHRFFFNLCHQFAEENDHEEIVDLLDELSDQALHQRIDELEHFENEEDREFLHQYIDETLDEEEIQEKFARTVASNRKFQYLYEENNLNDQEIANCIQFRDQLNSNCAAFTYTYLNHEKMIFTKCMNIYQKYFLTNQIDQERFMDLIFTDTSSRYSKDINRMIFEIKEDNHRYNFLENIHHYLYHRLMNLYQINITNKLDYEPEKYIHALTSHYFELFSLILYKALSYAYSSSHQILYFVAEKQIEKLLLQQMISSKRYQDNYEIITRYTLRYIGDFALDTEYFSYAYLTDEVRAIAYLQALVLDFDSNYNFFYKILKAVKLTEGDYPINQGNKKLPDNTKSLEEQLKENTSNIYPELDEQYCFNLVANFFELYKNDPVLLSTGSALSQMIFNIIDYEMDQDYLIQDLNDFSIFEEEDEYIPKNEFKVNSPTLDANYSQSSIDQIINSDDSKELKMKKIQAAVLLQLSKMKKIDEKKMEEVFNDYFINNFYKLKFSYFKDPTLGFHLGTEYYFNFLEDRSMALSIIITKEILAKRNNSFGHFFELSFEEQLQCVIDFAFYDHHSGEETTSIKDHNILLPIELLINDQADKTIVKQLEHKEKELAQLNQETEATKKELATLQEENAELQRQLAYYKKKEKESKTLTKQHEQTVNQLTSSYEKKVAHLTKQVEQYQSHEDELIKLRELFFLDANDQQIDTSNDTQDKEFLMEFCKNHSVVMAGGRIEVQRLLKKDYNVIPYGNIGTSNLDILKNADYIFISYKWFNHSDYARIQAIVSGQDHIKWTYLAHDNADLTIHDMVEFIQSNN